MCGSIGTDIGIKFFSLVQIILFGFDFARVYKKVTFLFGMGTCIFCFECG